MSSLHHDEQDGNNEAAEASSGVAQSRRPPAAADFGRITTRYMIAARVWTRAHRERALAAVKAAVVTWSGWFYVTLWTWRDRPCNPSGGTAKRPGWGKEFKTTIERYGATLAENNAKLAPKGQLACFTLGRSRHRGSLDDECLERTGIFLDSDDNGGWDEVRALARSIGLAFVAQQRPVRPLGHHVEFPVVRPWVPERDADGHVRAWKLDTYCPQLGWLMGVFSELAELRYEPAWDESNHATATHAGYDTACDRLLQLNFIYHRRPDDPPGQVPVTDYATGDALDVDALLAATEFEVARAALDRPIVRVAQAGVRPGAPAARHAARGLEEFEPRHVSNVELLVRLRRLRNPESQALINLLLDGHSYAPLGQRDTTMHRAASIVAALAPAEDPHQLAKLVFEKSLATMSKLPGADPVENYVQTYLALAAKKIERAQQRFGGGWR